MSDAPILLPTDLGRLRANVLDLELALADALATRDRDDAIAERHLADLSALYRAHVAALDQHELREVTRG
jgi:hypothetical protein